MSGGVLDIIPAERQEIARAALTSAFGAASIDGLQPVSGGASGALTYRVTTGERAWLLRMETRRSAIRNPHQYVCMQTAADAGIAPPLIHADADAGVAIMSYLPQRPLSEYAGGP